jgi:hypothetical protein
MNISLQAIYYIGITRIDRRTKVKIALGRRRYNEYDRNILFAND